MSLFLKIYIILYSSLSGTPNKTYIICSQSISYAF